jgi:hypothetical protein
MALVRGYAKTVVGDAPLHTALRLGGTYEETVWELLGGEADGGGGGEEVAAAVDRQAVAGSKMAAPAVAAAVGVVGKDMETPLHIASGPGTGAGARVGDRHAVCKQSGASPKVVARLLELGATPGAPGFVDARDAAGETALLRAVRRLCAAGDGDGLPPSSSTSSTGGAWEIVGLLLAAQADPNLGKAATGETPLMVGPSSNEIPQTSFNTSEA